MATIVYEHPLCPPDDDPEGQQAWLQTYVSTEFPPSSAAQDLMSGKSIEVICRRRRGKTEFAREVYRELRAADRAAVVLCAGSLPLKRFFDGMPPVEMDANGFANAADLEHDLAYRQERPIVIIDDYNYLCLSSGQLKDWAPTLTTATPDSSGTA